MQQKVQRYTKPSGLCTCCSLCLECMLPPVPLAYSLKVCWKLTSRKFSRSPLPYSHLCEMAFWFYLSQGTCHRGLGLLICLFDGRRLPRAEKIDIFFSSNFWGRTSQHKIYRMHKWTIWKNKIWGVLKMSPIWWFCAGQTLNSKKAADGSVFGREGPGLKWFLSCAPYLQPYLCWWWPLS